MLFSAVILNNQSQISAARGINTVVYSYSYVKKMANAGRVFWFLLVTMAFVLRESRQDRTTMSEGAGWEMGGGRGWLSAK